MFVEIDLRDKEATLDCFYPKEYLRMYIITITSKEQYQHWCLENEVKFMP